ncbi:MAG: PLP-dependent aminotransferase family protein [Trueperaceae bacterium]
MQDPFLDRLAGRMKSVSSSAIREILKLASQPNVISFAGGLPAPELFPIDEIRAAADRVLERSGRQALQYGPTEGLAGLRELIAQRANEADPDGALVEPDQVLITTGSQQALDLLGKVLIDTGDPIVTENPSYLGALQAFTLFQPTYWTVDMDDEGALPSELGTLLARSPKFAYILPTFQNPTGRTMGRARREEVAALFERHKVVLVEDDPYGSLTFGRAVGNTLRSMAPNVTLHLGTFSKILAPGLRLGWVIGPKQWVARMAQVKQSADLHTSTLSQHVALEVMLSGAVENHIQTICQEYGARCQAMLDSIEKYFPAGSKWTVPTGGMFVWVELPAGVDTAALLPKVVAEEKVAYVSGAPFHPNGGGENTMRLNFTHASADVVREGVARLGQALTRAMQTVGV